MKDIDWETLLDELEDLKESFIDGVHEYGGHGFKWNKSFPQTTKIMDWIKKGDSK